MVADFREADAVAAVRRLRAASVPLLVRVGNTQRLIVDDPALPGHSRHALPAHQIMAAARQLCRPVLGPSDDPTAESHPGLVAAVRVRLPAKRRNHPPDTLLLLAAGESGPGWPDELWLTDLRSVPYPELLRLARLAHLVDRDLVEIAEQVGIRDFAGRSFCGWHRHITLASTAHAVATLTAGTEQRQHVR